MYCIGSDEAGYGPRLGPLVISATVWELPEALGPEQMYAHLSPWIVAKASQCRGGPKSSLRGNRPGRSEGVDPPAPLVARCLPASFPRPLVLGDSKAVYDRHKGPPSLERTVLTMLALAGILPKDGIGLAAQIAWDQPSRDSALAWYPQYWPKIPQSISAEQIADLAEWVRAGMAAVGIRLVGVRSVLLFPERFNRRIEQYGNKATLLSWETLTFIRSVWKDLPGGPVQVVCDKHGGRDRYASLLSEIFSADFFQPGQVQSLQQGRQESIYQVSTEKGMVKFRFVCGGEALAPIALASMVSKYLRELAMEAWNRFWAEHVPGIRPTAGYPEDAQRFRTQIASRQAELGIPDHHIWRVR